ncbi:MULTISPECIES: hypothetical protein [Hyphomonas]|nr:MULTISPECIES: hypothetical protein [Hyphomonas]
MTCTNCRSMALATVALIGLPAFAQETQGQSLPNPQTAALMERIEQLEAELADLRGEILQSSETAGKAEAAAKDALDRVAEVQDQAPLVPAYSGPAGMPDTKWHLAGYADVGFVGGDISGPDSFVSGKFNPALHFQYKDFLLFEGELEYATTGDGETTSELEYSQIDLVLNDHATLVVGKYLSPIGQFQERLHPSWINKVQGAPAGFGHDGVQPASDTGVQLRGSLPAGSTRLTYALAVGNGPRTTSEGGVELMGMGSDENSNKSVGGRVGFFPVPALELGGSYLTARVDGITDQGVPVPAGSGLPLDARFQLWGVDAAYTKGPVAARFEYLKSERGKLFTITDEEPDGVLLPDLRMEAWYGQLSYRLSGFSDSEVIHKLEPVVRYGEFSIRGHPELEEENAQKRLNAGLNYWLAPTIVARAGFEWRDYTVPGVRNETLIQFQLGYGF